MTYLNGSESRYDGRTAEPVGDEGEVREVSLYAGLEDVLWPGVAQRRSVLVQQVHQLLRHLSANKRDFNNEIIIMGFRRKNPNNFKGCFPFPNESVCLGEGRVVENRATPLMHCQ
jgi:hypothetical protein